MILYHQNVQRCDNDYCYRLWNQRPNESGANRGSASFAAEQIFLNFNCKAGVATRYYSAKTDGFGAIPPPDNSGVRTNSGSAREREER